MITSFPAFHPPKGEPFAQSILVDPPACYFLWPRKHFPPGFPNTWHVSWISLLDFGLLSDSEIETTLKFDMEQIQHWQCLKDLNLLKTRSKYSDFSATHPPSCWYTSLGCQGPFHAVDPCFQEHKGVSFGWSVVTANNFNLVPTQHDQTIQVGEWGKIVPNVCSCAKDTTWCPLAIVFFS